MKPVAILVKDIPEGVREAVDRDAQERNIGVNDVVVEILCGRFRVPFKPSGYPYKESSTAQMYLRVPALLHATITEYKRERGQTARGVILTTLELHYDLPVSSTRRRPSREPLKPALVQDARARSEAGESLRSLARRYDVNRETLTRAIRSAA